MRHIIQGNFLRHDQPAAVLTTAILTSLLLLLSVAPIQAEELSFCSPDQVLTEDCVRTSELGPNIESLKELEDLSRTIEESLGEKVAEKGMKQVQANIIAALTAVKSVCTEDLLEESFTYKERCQTVKDDLSGAQDQLAELKPDRILP